MAFHFPCALRSVACTMERACCPFARPNSAVANPEALKRFLGTPTVEDGSNDPLSLLTTTNVEALSQNMHCLNRTEPEQSHQRPLLGPPVSPIRRSSKRQRIVFADDKNSILAKTLKGVSLHRLCCKPNVSVDEVEYVLRRDPSAATRRLKLKTIKYVYQPMTQTNRQGLASEPYTLPLNLAMAHHVNAEVLNMLIDAAPSVLMKTDGSMHESPLQVLLKHSRNDLATLDHMLATKPQCGLLFDRHLNTAIHTAVRWNASLPIVARLVALYPKLLRVHNRHHQTPGECAQQTSICSEAVCSYLWPR